MSDGLPISYYMGYALHALGTLVLLTVCIVLVVKQKSVAAVMMLLGTIFTILFSIGGIFWNQYAASENGSEGILEAQGLLSILSGLANLIFVVGVLLLALKRVQKTVHN